jgi:hypothetical protein
MAITKMWVHGSLGRDGNELLLCSLPLIVPQEYGFSQTPPIGYQRQFDLRPSGLKSTSSPSFFYLCKNLRDEKNTHSLADLF